jgi:hypothetical protein
MTLQSHANPEISTFGVSACLTLSAIEGTVSQDFFMNHLPDLLIILLAPFRSFAKIFKKILAAQGAQPVSTTPVVN